MYIYTHNYNYTANQIDMNTCPWGLDYTSATDYPHPHAGLHVFFSHMQCQQWMSIVLCIYTHKNFRPGDEATDVMYR